MKKQTRAEGYKRAWRFPPLVAHEIRKWILHPCLHVCSGRSPLGDVKMDLFERADVKADMRHLPFSACSFASVIWDPPYAAHRYKTMGQLSELYDSIQLGGRLITVHYFDPSCYLQRKLRLLYIAFYMPRQFIGVRVLTVCEKLPARRLKPKRVDRLVEVDPHIWEPDRLDLTVREVKE